MVYTQRFFFKCSLFHNSNLFGPCIIHVLYTGVLKLKKFQRQKINTTYGIVFSVSDRPVCTRIR